LYALFPFTILSEISIFILLFAFKIEPR
jgi:hypothetical protein